MSEMVERAAQAMFDANNGIDGDRIGDMVYDDFRISGSPDECVAMVMAVCRLAVRAAMAAMREPTGEMVSAACRVPDEGDGIYLLVQVWRAMNHAALVSGAEKER